MADREASGRRETKAPESAPKLADPPSPLATADREEERSVQLEQVAQQADRRTRHGCNLAGAGPISRRGPNSSARCSWWPRDSIAKRDQSTNAHGRALATAMTAMKEAEDFLPAESRLEADLDLPALVAAHATPVLKGHTAKLTPLTALRRYHTFAQEQLAAAAGREIAGSMALHALGKLHAALAQKKVASIVAPSLRPWCSTRPPCWSIRKTSWRPTIWACCWRSVAATVTPCRCSGAAWRSARNRPAGETSRSCIATGADRAGPAGGGTVGAIARRELARQKAMPAAGSGLVQWIDPQTLPKPDQRP